MVDKITFVVTNGYMSNEPHFKPFAREHKMLEEVVNGRKNIVVDMAKIADLADGDPADVIADEIFAAEIASQGSFKPYIVVEKPAMVDDKWVIRKTLSSSGQMAYDALKAGILWKSKEETPDYQGTIDYYRAMLAKNQIEMRYVDLLTETKTDELKDLRAELVYFKLRGQRKGDVIHGMVDAA